MKGMLTILREFVVCRKEYLYVQNISRFIIKPAFLISSYFITYLYLFVLYESGFR